MAAASATLNKTASSKSKKLGSLAKALSIILIVGGIIGIISSVAITVEKFMLLEDPSAKFGCDLNPVISCGSVMQSDQASAFGFMNTYIGLLGFPILVTVGAAMLAGAQFKRWFWLAMLGGLGLGLVFAFWLLYQSVFNIKALCPYCLAVDVALTTVFWYTLLYILEQKYIVLRGRARVAYEFARRHHADILILFFVILTLGILKHFWYYYGQFFS